MSNTESTTWLSQEAHDRLVAELETLETTGRDDIVARIAAAREEGDLKENGGYHAARDEQAKIEARIRQLTQLLKTATISEGEADTGIVGPGMLITATIAGDESTFVLGSREIIAPGSDLTVYSPSSPLGEAISGKSAGTTTSYTAPNGKEISVSITAVAPYNE
ncbi:transcription elongation factor GreA [Frondihabitans australicus]|uniref:Transcription elongation factor GreA n=1 Tax=Frondihabitans australicus TaxID=386892 RepID=A0A495IG58_9MICO|nr:transcription elongation factor GreA [Frondihabitans australicus]RKR75002.1 transcription elongation factor GreA [Frondihabitans australicus]